MGGPPRRRQETAEPLHLPAFCNNLNSMDGPLWVFADAPRQYQAVLEGSQPVASHRDPAALFRDLVERLPRAVSFDSLWLVLHDPARNRMRRQVLEGTGRTGGYGAHAGPGAGGPRPRAAEDGTLRLDASVLEAAEPRKAPWEGDVWRQNEKGSIETALAETRGRVAGPHGAAARLRIPAFTPESKIRALKIDQFKFRAASGD